MHRLFNSLIILVFLFSIPALSACSGGGGDTGGGCLDTEPCPAGQDCVAGTCVPEIPCTDSSLCDRARPFCDTSLGICVQHCTPICTGRCCGSDGCGGMCPDECALTGQLCNSNSCECIGECIPRTCESRDYECGSWPGGDGCGGDLECGQCPGSDVCNGSGKCVSDCTLISCAEAGYQCGVWPGADGCGGDLQCGECAGSLVCSAAGRCVGDCIPLSCEEAGYECGIWPGEDGCSGDLSCPACAVGWSCSEFGLCTEDCEPVTCDDLGYVCGDYADDCGGDLHCGECDDHSICNAQGQCETICDLDYLETDQVIDLDLKTVSITATLTLNQDIMPNDTGEDEDRGYVLFLDKITGTTNWIYVGPSGSAVVAGVLYAGLYDVYFETNSYQDNQDIPDGKVLIGRDVDCSVDRVFNWNLDTVSFSGSLTLNGSVMPDDTGSDEDRGYAMFTNRDTSTTVWVSAPPAGTASLSAAMWAGRYSVVWETNSYQDNQEIPDGRVLLEQDLDMTDDLQRTWDLLRVQLSGQITLNQQQMPDDTGADEDRGYLLVQDVQTGYNVWLYIGPAGSAAFDGYLFGGEKKLYFETNSYQDNDAIPDGKVQLEQSLQLNTDLVRSYDLPVVTVSGTVTMNQQQMPDDTGADEDRGWLVWRYTQTSYDSYAYLGPAGAAEYSVTLFGGEYQVYFETNSYQDNQSIPDGRRLLASDQQLASDQIQNFNLDTVNLHGTLTLNHTQMPDDTGADEDRGYLIFRDRGTGQDTWLAVGPSGPATWNGYLFAGTYDVSFETNSYQDNDSLPDGKLLVEKQVSCSVDQQLDWNLQAVNITGTVTHNGTLLADDPGADEDRGYVLFMDMNSGQTTWATLGPSGAGGYSVHLWEGSYNVQFEKNSYSEIELPGNKTNLLRGCLVSGACEHDMADITGVWDITFLNTAWNPNGFMAIDVVHAGTSLTGTYTSEQWYIGSGTITGGEINGAYISFHVDFEQTGDAYLTGTVANGCFMTGFAEVTGLNSDWIAEKRQ